MKILIVEDTPLAARMAGVIIEDLAFTPVIASDAKQALDLVREQVFDFIFMDIGLPDQDGFQVAQWIRQSDTPNATIPIIALTAHSSAHFQTKADEIGMNGYLVKPLTKSAADAIINKYLPFRENPITAMMQPMIAGLPMYLYYKDGQGRYLAATQYYVEREGIKTVRALLGKSDEDLKIGAFRPLPTDVIKSGGEINYKDKLEHTSNTKYKTVKFYMEDGKAVGFYEVLKEDPNRLMVSDDEHRANNDKDFLANLSHDLRMPLHVILGSAHIIERMESDPIKQEMIQGILEYGKLLSEYISNILLYIKASDHKIPLADNEFDMRLVLHDVVKMIRMLLGNKDVRVISKVAECIPDRIITDKHRFFRVLQNLLGNAAKYTHMGEINVTIDCLNVQKNEATLRMLVSDTGIGIEEGKKQRIFEKFHQISDGSLDVTNSGVGLGLSIVKQFVDDLGGDIDVDSVLGRGTSFICELPIRFYVGAFNHTGYEKI
jgi:CheY-like chemotaxis protein